MDQIDYEARLLQLEHLIREVDSSRQFWQISSIQAVTRASLAELKVKLILDLFPEYVHITKNLIEQRISSLPEAGPTDLWKRMGELAQRMSDGWVPFGWHANYNPCPDLEFDRNDLAEDGMPNWERRLGAFDPDDKYSVLPTLSEFLSEDSLSDVRESSGE